MRMKTRQSGVASKEEEEVGEASMSTLHHSASSSSFDDAMVDKNEEKTERCNTDVEEVV